MRKRSSDGRAETSASSARGQFSGKRYLRVLASRPHQGSIRRAARSVSQPKSLRGMLTIRIHPKRKSCIKDTIWHRSRREVKSITIMRVMKVMLRLHCKSGHFQRAWHRKLTLTSRPRVSRKMMMDPSSSSKLQDRCPANTKTVKIVTKIQMSKVPLRTCTKVEIHPDRRPLTRKLQEEVVEKKNSRMMIRYFEEDK